MNKYDFLSRLRNALSSLPKEERDAAMNYYEEFFSDAGEDNEQAVIASLGTPEELAKSIIDENNRDNPAGSAYSDSESYSSSESTSGFNPPPTPAQTGSRWTGGQTALFIILAVLSSPIWGGILAAVLGALAGLFAAVIGIIAAFGGCAIGFFASGITALFHEPIVGILCLGVSFVFIGLFPLAIVPMCQGIVKLSKACIKGISALINKITGKKEAVQ